MSQPSNPYNRPLPPEIYRRRRIAAGVGLLVLVLVLVLIVRAITGGGGDSTETAADSSTSSATAGSSESATGSADASSGVSTSETSGSSEASEASEGADPSESRTAEPTGTCNVDDLRLEVRSGAPTYAGGQLPDFIMSVTNNSEADCTVDLEANPMSFEVFNLASYERIWGDTDCNEPTASEDIDLAAGESRNFALNGWSRTTSAPDQCADRADAGTGAFLLYGHLGDKVSEPATFNLA
ncbi:hypothetical protein [Corynebacterium variabile]|uniref:hypothetical protein n=1 Tax=Corynebacterium variabile TaxID=1727 RepID=UPI001D636F99|nr:hypothetical protein [Corynebacterium variabile]HJG46362.1 hypothetical protein [Corynebacterium variabile]